MPWGADDGTGVARARRHPRTTPTHGGCRWSSVGWTKEAAVASVRRGSAAVAVALCAAVCALAGPISPAGAADLIVNGSFETPDVPTGFYGIFPAIPGWSHAPRGGTTSSGIEIQDHVAGAPAAGAGAQFVELDSDGPSVITQSVPTSPGSTYRLSFIYTARPGYPPVQNHFMVTAGPASAEIGPLPAVAQTTWTPKTVDWVATAASSAIQFTDLSPEEPVGGASAYIDLVSVELINSPPVCTGVAPSSATLWPPNHKLRTVTLAGATDPDGDVVTIAVGGVTQDEPLDGAADGSTTPDAMAGASGNQVRLRAERSGRGDGRVYRVAFTATDPSGASCTGTAKVSVPHDRRGAAAVDSGGTVDSMSAAAQTIGKGKQGKGNGKGKGPKPH
jgi:hypothetical protein